MIEASPQQVSRWNSFLKLWRGRVRKNVLETIARAEFCAALQVFCENNNIDLILFTGEDLARVKRLIDVFNRMESSITKVERGTYGVNFINGDIDVMAPPNMTDDEIQGDIITGSGFGIVPIIWVIVVGAVVVGSLFGTAAIVEQVSTKQKTDDKSKIVNALLKIKNAPKEVQTELARFLDDEKPRIEKAGLLDQLLGTGSGGTIAAAIGIGVVLYAFAASRRK